MKIVVLDGYTLNPGDNPWDPLAALGDLTVYDRTNPEDVLERSRGAEILITNKTRLNADTLAALPDLRCIGVIATGYDVVDIAAAGKRGIPVMNVVNYGTEAVAQHAFALLLELCRRTALHDAGIRSGRWAAGPDWCFWDTPQVELSGKVMGILGFGTIGRRVAELAHAFGMKVIAASARKSRIFPCRICGDGRTVPRFGRAVPALPADGSDPRHRQRRQHRFHEGRGHPPESCARAAARRGRRR